MVPLADRMLPGGSFARSSNELRMASWAFTFSGEQPQLSAQREPMTVSPFLEGFMLVSALPTEQRVFRQTVRLHP
jgi:hypothetical protein